MKSPKSPNFPPAAGTPNLPEMEEKILAMWEELNTFQETVNRPSTKGNFVFYEGPPTANNVPHPGHVMTRVLKDLFPRFKTMNGYKVVRKAGWDTHGLPVEISIEKELGLQGKQEIEEYGLEAFNAKCFGNVRKYEKDWRKLSNRIGFWLDYDDAYFTFTNKYIETVWWLLAKFFNEGLLYKGHKVLPYCPLCGTTHSSHEVAQAYKDVKDPSVTARFKVTPGQTITDGDSDTHITEQNTYILAWTTTPWTLLSNVGLAVHPTLQYKMVRSIANPEHLYIIADGMKVPVEEVITGENGKAKSVDLRDQPALLSFTGEALQDLRYERLYSWDEEVEGDGWRVVTADYVTAEDGTGIVHTAPAFGEEDYKTATKHGLPFLCALAADGKFRPEIPVVAGLWFKDADREVIGDLKTRGLLFKTQRIEHPYPYCWRHDTPLHYFATSSWFIRTTQVREKLIENNQKIEWRPGHIQDGRFGKWLEGVIDWALSRKRYWGTPLPIWTCDDCGSTEAIGSYSELFKRTGSEQPSDLYDQEKFNPHRPYIDTQTLTCTKCSGTMHRVEEVIDCWFDSGAMPYAQYHYPFENKELIDGNEGQTQYPADFISEAIDQTRGWFYTLHAISTLLTGKPAYKNCLVMGHVLDGNGQKMSKSRGNVLDPWEVLNTFGADAFRWHFYRNMGPGQPARFSHALVRESVKSFLLPLWNAVSFFTIYANIDGWKPGQGEIELAKRPALDRWILSQLSVLIDGVTDDLEHYKAQEASRALEAFLDQLNNWYIRRSRRRFWSEAEAIEKESAYQTLHTVLTTVTRLLAPFLPFTAEELYQRLDRPFYTDSVSSVHLTSYPTVGGVVQRDEALETSMAAVLRATSLALGARNKSNIKVRQPLERLWLVTVDDSLPGLIGPFEDLITEEINVNTIEWAKDRSQYVTYRCTPNFRVLGRRFGKLIPKVKAAVAAADPSFLISEMESNGSVTLQIDGKDEAFTKDELDVSIQQREGTITANDDELLVALDTEITPALKQQGLVRELVNRIQGMRKDADLEYTDRIDIAYKAQEDLAQAIEEHGDYIQKETLCSRLVAGSSESALLVNTDELDGHELTLALNKAST